MYPRTLDADQDTKVDADGGERTVMLGDKTGRSPLQIQYSMFTGHQEVQAFRLSADSENYHLFIWMGGGGGGGGEAPPPLLLFVPPFPTTSTPGGSEILL